MLLPSFDKSRTITATVTLVTLATLVFLGGVAAHWTWNWLAPLPTARALPVAVATGQMALASDLFGGVATTGNRLAPAGNAIRLLGIIADATTHHGYAVLQVEPREVLVVREGEDVASGIRLAKVGPDHIVLERAGMQETIAWPEKKSAAETTAPRLGK